MFQIQMPILMKEHNKRRETLGAVFTIVTIVVLGCAIYFEHFALTILTAWCAFVAGSFSGMARGQREGYAAGFEFGQEVERESNR